MNAVFFEQEIPKIDWTPLFDSIDWSELRRPRKIQDWLLMWETSAWLNTLPVGARPLLLPKRFPRIANELCNLWSCPEELEDYFDELLVGREVERKGLPPLVREELQALYAYSLCMRDNPWSRGTACAFAA